MKKTDLPNAQCQTRAASAAEGVVLVLGVGAISRRWRHLLSSFGWPLSSQSNIPERQPPETAVAACSCRAILWQSTEEPVSLIRKLTWLPQTIPLLLRHQPERQNEADPALLKKLKRRPAPCRLSLPLRFWPPACRLWEVVATEMCGGIREIESTLRCPAGGTDADDPWYPTIRDLMDFHDCLMDEPAKPINPTQSQKGAVATAEYSKQRKATIRQTTTTDKTLVGIQKIKVKAAHGELILAMAPGNTADTRQPGESRLRTATPTWHLHRRLSAEISRRQPAPTTVPAGDPVALELRYFLRQLASRP